MQHFKSRFKMLTLGAVLAMSAGSFHANASILLTTGTGPDGFGELALTPNDDGSSQEITFDEFSDLGFDGGVNFFGTVYDSFFINNNGNITFNSGLGSFTPVAFPIASQPMIAPFWADVDTRCDDCGDVYIGSPDANTLTVTWNEVGFYNQNSSPTNTFQLVLIDRSDTGEGNFDVEFRYENIEWTTGEASGGDANGLGGTPAQVGYDAGNGTDFFTVPGSFTSDIVNIDTADSNTGTPGIWKFAIRDGELPGDTPENPLLPIINPETPTDYEFEFVITEPSTPIFIDPEVAVGYDYIVNSGPSILSVILPTGFGDDVYDLWLWDAIAGEWFDTGEDIFGGIEYFFASAVDMFRILGIETSALVDPFDPQAFVTGLSFDSAGVVNINQNAIIEYVPDGQIPEPHILTMFATSLILLFGARRKKH